MSTALRENYNSNNISKPLTSSSQILDELRKKTMVALFVELIRPPMFGAGKDIDSIVGGEKLVNYKHKLRGERTIYRIDV